MPKSAKNSGRHRIESISGSSYGTLFTATTSGQINIHPSNSAFGTHLTSIADSFNLCRCVHLELEVPPSAGQDYAVGVAMGVVDTAPTTVANIIQFEYSLVHWSAEVARTRLVVPRKYLVRGQVPWWKTQLGASDDQFEIQGAIFAGATGSMTLPVLIRYTWEFTDWAATAATPFVDKQLLVSALSSNAPFCFAEVKRQLRLKKESEGGSNPEIRQTGLSLDSQLASVVVDQGDQALMTELLKQYKQLKIARLQGGSV